METQTVQTKPEAEPIEIMIGKSFYPMLVKEERYLVFCGGAGSGKSEFIGRKIFYRCMTEGNHKVLVLRKVRVTCRESVIAVIKAILDDAKIRYTENKTDRIIIFYNTRGQRNEILFDGLDDKEKIKSIKGITMLWLEEATEFTELDFVQIDLRLRDETKYYKQIMLSFNPDEAVGAWLKELFFFDEHVKTGIGKHDDSYIHHSTIEDNPILAVQKEYRVILERIKDPVYFEIYRRGFWALAKGIIFDWDVVPLPEEDRNWFDDIFYGGDFGYSVDPAALVEIYRKANEFWVKEIIYERGLTNIALANKMIDDKSIDHENYSYWDSAEPKSVQELYDMGVNSMEALKGPDSVRASIDFLKSMTIHIIEGSENLISERKSYKWQEDKDGNSLNKPVDFKNHAIDATRYGIYTHLKEFGDHDMEITVL